MHETIEAIFQDANSHNDVPPVPVLTSQFTVKVHGDGYGATESLELTEDQLQDHVKGIMSEGLQVPSGNRITVYAPRTIQRIIITRHPSRKVAA